MEDQTTRIKMPETNQDQNQGGQGEKWWKKVKCFIFQEVDHTKRFYPKRGRKSKEQEETKGEVAVVKGGYDSAEVLVVSTVESKRN